jgi:uncharacterized protein YacL
MFGDISKISNNTDLIYIITAVFIIDLIVIIIAKQYNKLGKQINVWYDKLGLTAVLLDVTIIIIGFIITRYIYYVANFEFNPLGFIITSLIVQVIHDMLLYIYLILPTKYGVNNIIDIYKDYAKEGGGYIILADSLMVLGSGIIAMLLKNSEMHYTSSLLVLSIYLIPYFTNIK